MKATMEAMVDFVLLVLLILLAFGFISMHLNTQNARNFHALAVDEVENSNFSETAVEGLKQEARRQGYTLEIKQTKVNGVQTAEVVLGYTYSIPLLRIFNEPQAIRGMAR